MKAKTMGLVIWTATAMALASTAAADSSAIATVLDMSFDGELTTDSSWDLEGSIKDQLLYTIGSLNASNSVGRLDKVVLTHVQRTSLGGGRSKVTYHAKMPVAWGSKTNLPTSFTFTLPRDVSYAGLEAFATRYKNSCVDFGAHDVNSGSMWFYYRPRASGCSFAEADIARFTASAVVSPNNTTGKFPEYNKVWEDGELRVIAIFAKYEVGATTGADAGISAYNEFLRDSKSRLRSGGSGYETVPASVPSFPGVSVPIVEQRVQLPDGKRVTVSAFLVDNPSAAGAVFDTSYENLSGRADLIVYNGRAALGANVRALARRGSWIAGQYVMVFMNASDTYAYIDSTLFDRHAAVNPDDPAGTKHTDVIVNAMPSFFSSQSGATMAFINALLSYTQPAHVRADLPRGQPIAGSHGHRRRRQHVRARGRRRHGAADSRAVVGREERAEESCHPATAGRHLRGDPGSRSSGARRRCRPIRPHRGGADHVHLRLPSVQERLKRDLRDHVGDTGATVHDRARLRHPERLHLDDRGRRRFVER